MSAPSFASAVSRAPRVYSSDRAAEAASLLGDLPADLRDVLCAAVSTSSFLMTLLQKETDWFLDALSDPAKSVQEVIDTSRAGGEGDLGKLLRQSKRRVALMTAMADLTGVWGLETVTRSLTHFADAACQSALRGSLAAQIRRGKLPGKTEADLDTAAGMVVLAMGKMGAGELNYSSDIDLICLFDETRHDPADYHEARSAFIRATRNMCSLLSDMNADGYVFRTDLRLRPDSGVTPVCMPMETAERYYESLGRTWERAAYIKARPCAGDIAAGEAFLATLQPFVWRRHLDFAAIQDAHDMRLAIREHKGLGGPITLPGHDMKLGRGGIREIEFFTQTRQLIAGGRDVDLRLRGTVPALQVLAAKNWVPQDVADALCEHYEAHRMIEHRLQMVQDAQTHDLPQTEAGFERLACMMGMDRQTLEADLQERLGAVHELTEGFFAASRAPAPVEPPAAHVFDSAVIERWLTYPALRSPRGAELFARLKPDLLARLAKAGKPDEALLAFDGFLAGLPAGVQLFSLLKANPQLADLLIDVVSTSPKLAAHLSRNAGVFDAVIGGDFFADWPGRAALQQSLARTLAREEDYELQLDGARRWAREWHFRIGVHHLRGLIDADTAGAQYADLAHVVLTGLWPVVQAHFARRHGPPPGRGAVLLGMGSLGAGRLTATSDLDMIVIYDPAEAEASEGRRPLATRPYYARLTQAMITAMTAPMAQGKLYEVDMRLRPSGNQGPVATSLASFESYQRNEAWVWEHLALTRAQVVTGPGELADAVESLRRSVLCSDRPRAEIIAQVIDMRARIAAAKSPGGPFDAKIGPGRLQDIELFAQTGALLTGGDALRIADGLAAAAEAGLVTQAQAEVLSHAYARCWTMQSAARLLSSKPLDPATIGQAGADFLCRSLGCADLEALERRMTAVYAEAAKIIADALSAAGQNARRTGNGAKGAAT